MTLETLTQRLKTHGLTTTAVIALIGYFMWMPSTPGEVTVLHTIVALALACLVFVLAGGHTVLLPNRALSLRTLGVSVLFFAIPIAFLLIDPVLTFLDPSSQSYMYPAGGRVVKPFWLDLLYYVQGHALLLLWIVPLTMGTLIAKTRPASVAELKDLYWFSVPLIASYATYFRGMNAFHDAVHPIHEVMGGAGYVFAEIVVTTVGACLALGVAWAVGLVAYRYLPDLESPSDAAPDPVTDGGRE